MACKCGSQRIITINAKAGDRCNWQMPGGTDHDGHTPTIEGFSGGDYITTDICLDCGQIQGDWPQPTPEGYE